jgi:hypothetical protein
MPGYSPASAPKTCGMTDARRSSRRGATASQPLRGLVTGTDHRDRLRPRPCAGRPVVERGLQDRRGHHPRSAAGRGLAGPGTRWCGSLAASADALKSFQQRETHSLTTPAALGPVVPWTRPLEPLERRSSRRKARFYGLERLHRVRSGDSGSCWATPCGGCRALWSRRFRRELPPPERIDAGRVAAPKMPTSPGELPAAKCRPFASMYSNQK